MQERGPAPRGGKGSLTWAAARHLAGACSRANHTSEDVAATVGTAPGKHWAVRGTGGCSSEAWSSIEVDRAVLIYIT